VHQPYAHADRHGGATHLDANCYAAADADTDCNANPNSDADAHAAV
jgi:hypothetical protein